MSKKIAKNIVSVVFFILISGCASTTTANLACDFAEGAADNAIKRHENKNNSDIHGNIVKDTHNSDFLEGILSILGGVATRAINSDDREACT